MGVKNTDSDPLEDSSLSSQTSWCPAQAVPVRTQPTAFRKQVLFPHSLTRSLPSSAAGNITQRVQKTGRKGTWTQVDSRHVMATSQESSGFHPPLPAIKQGSGNPKPPFLPSLKIWNVSFPTMACQAARCSIWLSLITRERQRFLLALLSNYNSCEVSPLPCSNWLQPAFSPHFFSL